MAARLASVVLLAIAVPCVAQKCKGMDIKYENNIQYPTAARASRLEGEVALHLQVDAEGKISKIDILSGPPSLAESAKRFVESWSITWPGDKPIACDPTLRVRYKLTADRFDEKMHLPTHITVEAPAITTH